MPTVSIGNENIYYERAGSGVPLVLMHSLGTSSALWVEQFEHWRNTYDVIAMDARGHGGSTNVGGVSIENIAADLINLLKQLDVLPAHFVGISMGGMICSRLHELSPKAVRSLVISGSLATAGPTGAQKADGLEARIRSISLMEYGRLYAEKTLLPTTATAKHEALSASIGRMEQASYIQTVRSIFTDDVSHCMKKMAVPALVLVGRQDQRTPVTLAKDIAALIEGSELVILEEAAHLANLDNPHAFEAAVDAFLRRIEGRIQ